MSCTPRIWFSLKRSTDWRHASVSSAADGIIILSRWRHGSFERRSTSASLSVGNLLAASCDNFLLYEWKVMSYNTRPAEGAMGRYSVLVGCRESGMNVLRSS